MDFLFIHSGVFWLPDMLLFIFACKRCIGKSGYADFSRNIFPSTKSAHDIIFTADKIQQDFYPDQHLFSPEMKKCPVLFKQACSGRLVNMLYVISDCDVLHLFSPMCY